MAYPPGVGAGALWRIGSGEFADSNEDGTVGGLAAAQAAVSAAGGGGIYMGPGLEGIPLAGFASNLILHQITKDGRYIVSGLQLADVLDPTKRLRIDPSGISAATVRVARAPDHDGYLLLPVDGGTDGYHLRSKGPTAQPVWEALAPALHDLLDGAINQDTLAAAVVRGDLIVGNSTPKWARLPRGTNGQVLGTDGTDVFWTGTGVSAVEHNALAHIRAIRATGCSINNGSDTLTTTGDQFAGVRVGDRVNFDVAPTSLWGRYVSALIDSNNVKLDAANAGSTQTGRACVFTPGDHVLSSISEANGYLLACGIGTYDASATPGGTFQELRGPINWDGYESGHSTDFRVVGSSVTITPSGFCIRKRGTTFKVYFMVNNVSANRVLTIPDRTDEIVLLGGSQTLQSKTLTTGNKVVMDGTATYSAFQSAALVDRLSFDLTVPTALRSVKWPDLSGMAVVRNAQVDQTAQSASIGSTALATAPPAGLYRVSVYMRTGTTGVGNTTVDIGWNDGGAKTKAPLATLDMTGANYAEATLVIYVASGNVTYSTTYGGGGSETYDIRIRMEAL
jgi:hypothetical protein